MHQNHYDGLMNRTFRDEEVPSLYPPMQDSNAATDTRRITTCCWIYVQSDVSACRRACTLISP